MNRVKVTIREHCKDDEIFEVESYQLPKSAWIYINLAKKYSDMSKASNIFAGQVCFEINKLQSDFEFHVDEIQLNYDNEIHITLECSKTKAKIYLNINNYGNQDKIAISGSYRIDDKYYDVRAYETGKREKYPEIKCTIKKDSQKVAKDIVKRFLPDYLKFWNRLVDRHNQHNDYLNKLEIVKADYEKLLTDNNADRTVFQELKKQNDSTEYIMYVSSFNGGHIFEGIRLSADSFMMAHNSFSHDIGMKMLKLFIEHDNANKGKGSE